MKIFDAIKIRIKRETNAISSNQKYVKSNGRDRGKRIKDFIRTSAKIQTRRSRLRNRKPISTSESVPSAQLGSKSQKTLKSRESIKPDCSKDDKLFLPNSPDLTIRNKYKLN